jgi:hypothetical protein
MFCGTVIVPYLEQPRYFELPIYHSWEDPHILASGFEVNIAGKYASASQRKRSKSERFRYRYEERLIT